MTANCVPANATLATPWACPFHEDEAQEHPRDILIVWDGSRRTISALQELVATARSRRFILAEFGRARPSAEDAAAWLAAHGSTARVERLPRCSDSGPALRDICMTTRPGHCLADRLCSQVRHGSNVDGAV